MEFINLRRNWIIAQSLANGAALKMPAQLPGALGAIADSGKVRGDFSLGSAHYKLPNFDRCHASGLAARKPRKGGIDDR
ncbi:MAG: hypothetical protein ABIM50_14030 [Novosphingobium sp.]